MSDKGALLQFSIQLNPKLLKKVLLVIANDGEDGATVPEKIVKPLKAVKGPGRIKIKKGEPFKDQQPTIRKALPMYAEDELQGQGMGISEW